jgi:asparagine synthase (glutamine-hydrolysing)
LKALLADPNIPRKLNLEALTFYLTFGYVPGHRCLLEGFCKLPPAHAAIFDLETGDLHRWQYWELPSGPVDGLGQPVDGEQLAEELGHLLGDSVRRQLVADVPVGVLLSGGIDSSLVTAMAAKNTQSLKTFTITFPDYGPYDEAPHARLIAEQFATEHVELVAEPSTIDLLPELARQFDEPIVDSSMIPTYLVSCLVREHCTVALGGDGGDELFGGYEHYSQLLKMNRRIGWVPRRLRAAAASLAQALLPVGLPGRNLVMRMTANFDNGFSETARLFDFTSRRKLLSDEVTKTIDDRSMLEELSARLSQSGDGIVDKAQRLDFQTYLPEDILVKVDRTSMLNSLEVRAPLLDYRIIEFAFGRIPPVLKVGPNNKKILLKMLGKRVLPSSFHTERKQGFSVPLADWLRKEWRVPFAALLLDRSTALWKRSEIERIWKNHCRGFSNSERLFGIVMFELWRNHYRISL